MIYVINLMKILTIILLTTLLSARKLIPLTKEKKEFILSKGFDVDENSMEAIYDELPTGFPAEFDSRENWPHCMSMMQNEGECQSSWAMAASSVMSDRFCISLNKASSDVIFSPQYLLSCLPTQTGCKNKQKTDEVFKYLRDHGLPTEECVPYNSADGKARECSKDKCTKENKSFDLKKCAKDIYFSSSDAIKQEIYTHGPVYCTFNRYADFDNYKSGIYYMVSSPYNDLIEENRGVKVIGWGVENGIHFWIAMNSWGEKWGENAYFRIRMLEVNICEVAATCEPPPK